jgi:hypothetical protein
MPLDRSLRLTFRSFVTLFFIAAVITVPLHVGHSFVHRRAIGVRELHPFIREFPSDARKVHGVGQSEVEEAETSLRFVSILELALLPLMAGAARRALIVDAGGSVATVADAWAHCLTAWRRPAPARVNVGVVLCGCIAGAAVVFLAESITAILAEPLGESVAFGLVGLGDAAARALGAPFVLVPFALIGVQAKGRATKRPTN